MVTGGPGDLGDSAPVPVVEEFSLLIVTAIIQLLETTAGTALARGPSTAPATSDPAQQMVRAFRPKCLHAPAAMFIDSKY